MPISRPERRTGGGGDGWRQTDGWTATKAGTLGWEGANQSKQDFLNQSVRHCSEDEIPKAHLSFSFAKLAILSSYTSSKISKSRFSVHSIPFFRFDNFSFLCISRVSRIFGPPKARFTKSRLSFRKLLSKFRFRLLENVFPPPFPPCLLPSLPTTTHQTTPTHPPTHIQCEFCSVLRMSKCRNSRRGYRAGVTLTLTRYRSDSQSK